MEQMKEKKIAKKKHLIGSIILLLAVITIVIPALKIYADAVAAAIVEDEKTIVRTASALSRGENVDSIVDIDTLPTFLNKYAGNGATTVASATSEIIKVTFASTGHVYDINIYTGPTFDVVGGSSPYIPTGYTAVPGTDLTTGFVVQDQKGNQFVWVEVPRTSEVYPTAGLGITSFTDDEYNLIEADLHTYTSVYRRTGFVDEYYSDEATGLTNVEYNTQKKKMLKSIYKYGGFYVGRYETGINYSQSHRTASGDTTQTPVIKQNAYPYNFVTVSQAQELSESFSTTGYSSSLMFGVQWDLIMKYFETKGTTQNELMTDSTSWGNHQNTTYNITDTNIKHSLDSGATWSSEPYEKTTTESVMLSTGSFDTFSKQNINDMAGNIWEFTLEYTGYVNYPNTARGGTMGWPGSTYAANYHQDKKITDASCFFMGFRVALYKEEANTKNPSYIPTGYTHVAGTDMDTGYVVQDELGNQYVWVEVPRTAAVYSTAGVNITSFTADEFTAIETDLHTYTSTYGNFSYSDTYSADLDMGLTEYEYNTQKKKMLKSIYKNEGFYVGRYETGIDYSEDYRIKTDEDIEQTPVIKQNAYPYNFVSVSQAQELSESFASELEGYTSSLMFGVQFELILKYLETKGASQAELITDSSCWGNYNDSLYNITNTNAKYYQFLTNDDVITWNSAPYSKTSTSSIFLTTGASDTFSKQNIYDLAGNMWERTLERVATGDGQEGNYGIFAGAGHLPGSSFYVARRYGSAGTKSRNGGFRVSLYKDEGTGKDSTTTKPTYIPAGYTHVAGTTMENGYVIEDQSGNQYVWVEVPKTAAVYPTAGVSITNFTGTEFDAIEADLHTYTTVYRNGTTYKDTWLSEDAMGMSETEYNTQKKKMLKSIYKNGGFYVGRYETGTTTARKSASDALGTPVIKQNAYPYGFVTTAQSQDLAERFKTAGYETSVMFGVQWDLVMKYLETKGTTQAELKTDSTSWGNYGSNLWNVTNTNSKYCTDSNNVTWTNGAYGQKTTPSIDIMLSTGADDSFKKQNIYDLAGNGWEFTIEKAGTNSTAIRGGNFAYGWEYPANLRASRDVGTTGISLCFRVALYKDETDEMDGYTRYYDANNLDGNGATGVATTTLKDLTGNYDATIYASPTFGNGYISLNSGSSTQQYIDIGPILDKSVLTWNLKFSANEIGSKMYLLGNLESGGFGLSLLADGKLRVQVYADGGTAYTYAASTNAIEANTIYDATGVYDGTYLYFYINGTLQTKVETSGGNIKNPSNNEHVVIGANPTGTGISSADTANIKVYSASISEDVKHPAGQETQPTTYTITYNNNGRGTAPAAQTATAGEATTLSTSTLTATGYTFKGWATSSTATTAEYAAGASYTGTADVTLYAVWQINTYTVTLNANGGTFALGQVSGTGWNGTASGTTVTTTVEYGTSLTIPSATGFKPTRSGYTFLGWAIIANATTAAVQPGASVTITANRTLYAVWQQDTSTETTVTITLNANGGTFDGFAIAGTWTGTAGGTTRTATVTQGTAVTLPTSSGNPTRDGYTFKGWGLTALATSPTYLTGSQITASATRTYYAVWEANSGSDTGTGTGSGFTITYHAGTSGKFASTGTYMMSEVDTTGKITTEIPTRTNYTFKGWGTALNSTTVTYTSGQSVTFTKNTTLYAVWQQGVTSKLDINHMLNKDIIKVAMVPMSWISMILGF